ncbi:MAG: helix-turn-helix domain-containing protein [Anaerolineae bacterium]|nr:helix-turn-helix domain-containing protein [Anaerolineae bacterium]
MSDDLISIQEAAAIIGVSPQQVNRYCVTGVLPSIEGQKAGKGVHRQIRRADVANFVRPKRGPKGPRRAVAVAALLLALILTFGVRTAAAQSVAPPPLADPQNLTSVLGWLAAGGAAPAISLLLSKQKWFNAITNPQAKVWIVMSVVVGLPLLAKALTDFIPANVWDAIQPWWAVAVAAFEIGWPLSQVTHLCIGKNLKQG